MPVTGNEVGGEYIFQNLFGSLSPESQNVLTRWTCNLLEVKKG